MSLLLASLFLFHSVLAQRGGTGVNYPTKSTTTTTTTGSQISSIIAKWSDDYRCNSLQFPSWTVDPEPVTVTTFTETRYDDNNVARQINVKWHGPYTAPPTSDRSQLVRTISRDFQCQQLSSISISFAVVTCGTTDSSDSIQLEVFNEYQEKRFSLTSATNPTSWNDVPSALATAASDCSTPGTGGTWGGPGGQEWNKLGSISHQNVLTVDPDTVFSVVFQLNIQSGSYFAFGNIGIMCSAITTEPPEDTTTTTSSTTSTTSTTAATTTTSTTATTTTTSTTEASTTSTTSTTPLTSTTSTSSTASTEATKPDTTASTATTTSTTTTTEEPDTTTRTSSTASSSTSTTRSVTSTTTSVSEDPTTSRKMNEGEVVEDTTTTASTDSDDSNGQRDSQQMMSGLLAGDTGGTMVFVIVGCALGLVVLFSVICVYCRVKRRKSVICVFAPDHVDEDQTNDVINDVTNEIAEEVNTHAKKDKNESISLQITWSPKQQNIFAVNTVQSMSNLDEGDYQDSDDDVVIGMHATRGGDENDDDDEFVPPPPAPPVGYDTDGDLIAGPETTGGGTVPTAGYVEDSDDEYVPPPPVPPVPQEDALPMNTNDGGNTAGEDAALPLNAATLTGTTAGENEAK
eukprot:955460_1